MLRRVFLTVAIVLAVADVALAQGVAGAATGPAAWRRRGKTTASSRTVSPPAAGGMEPIRRSGRRPPLPRLPSRQGT